jgi:hypothetical protein
MSSTANAAPMNMKPPSSEVVLPPPSAITTNPIAKIAAGSTQRMANRAHAPKPCGISRPP